MSYNDTLPHQIGTVELTKEKVIRNSYETASWYMDVKCPPQKVPLYFSGRSVWYKVTGICVAENFCSEWGGVPFGKSTQEDIGKEREAGGQLSFDGLLMPRIWFQNDGDVRITLDPEKVKVLRQDTYLDIGMEKPEWQTFHTPYFVGYDAPQASSEYSLTKTLERFRNPPPQDAEHLQNHVRNADLYPHSCNKFPYDLSVLSDEPDKYGNEQFKVWYTDENGLERPLGKHSKDWLRSQFRIDLDAEIAPSITDEQVAEWAAAKANGAFDGMRLAETPWVKAIEAMCAPKVGKYPEAESLENRARASGLLPAVLVPETARKHIIDWFKANGGLPWDVRSVAENSIGGEPPLSHHRQVRRLDELLEKEGLPPCTDEVWENTSNVQRMARGGSAMKMMR